MVPTRSSASRAIALSEATSLPAALAAWKNRTSVRASKVSAKKRAAAASTRAKVPAWYTARTPTWSAAQPATGLSPNAMTVRMLTSIPISLSDRPRWSAYSGSAKLTIPKVSRPRKPSAMTVAIAARGFLARNITPVPVLWSEYHDLQELVGDDCQQASIELGAGDWVAAWRVPDARWDRRSTVPS